MLQPAVPAGAFVLRGNVRLRVFAIVALLFIAGAAIRAAIAAQGGLWADEAFFLSIVNTPEWTAMLAFLAEHESHPPLFYMIMRAWVSIAGDSDAATRLLAVVIGSAVIPMVYFVGSRLLSVRAGLVAAFLCTVSPAVSEHGAQLRPYGLLPLAALSSCYFLVRLAGEDSLRLRALYVITTLAMLYTHHWGWIIVAGQQVAWVYVFMRRRENPLPVLRRWLFVSLGVALGYLPWLTAMVRQSMHAGHGGIPVDGAGDAVMLVMFGAFTFVSTLFPGRFSSQETVAAFSVIVAAAVAVAIHLSRGKRGKAFAIEETGSAIATPALAAVCIGASAAAIALSPFSNLLWPRCVATLVPLLALIFAQWCVRAWSGSRRMAVGSGMLCSVIIVNAAFDLYVLTTTPRSNAREVARIVARHSTPADLVIIAPQWYEPSFARYFGASVPRIEFPASRSDRLVDFSNVWERVSAPLELKRVLASADTARASGKRVWLVSSRQYLRHVSDAEVAQAMRHHHPKPIGVRAVNTIRDSLTQRFGAPDTTVRAAGPEPLYDALVAYLYTHSASRK